MRKIFLVVMVLFVTGCAEKQLDVEKAKQVAEQMIVASDAGDYDAVEKLYTSEFLSGEGMDEKKKKMEKLRNVLGEVKAYEFIRYTSVAEFGQPQKMIVEYLVHHKGQETIEKFTIVEDEGGYKIGGYSVESKK